MERAESSRKKGEIVDVGHSVTRNQYSVALGDVRLHAEAKWVGW